MFDKNSRYAKVGKYVAPGPNKEPLETFKLREAPRPEGVFFHQPVEGERLDHLAHTYLRDPRRFWRICDSADALDPFDVVVPGAPVRIPPQR